MRKLRMFEHISLDGVIQSSGEDDFPYSDWTAPVFIAVKQRFLVNGVVVKIDLPAGELWL